nr:phosphate/phosphite/phosphonate ABC transporter substrate-binding protein [Sneathiella aquimaris]
MRSKLLLCSALLGGFLVSGMTTPAHADCARGSLDEKFCDVDGDLVADPPMDESKWKDPSTLVFTYTPVEDPAVYRDAFADFQEYLSKATGKKVIYYTVQSNSAEIEAMRSGRLHIAGFSTGPTGFAVNLAGAVPIAVKGGPDGFQGYNLILITRKDSGIKSLADLKGKKVAHTSPSSNSGNLAPRALLPDEGITPDKDYTVAFSGKHDQSILGVVSGDYDAAPVASDVYERMVARGVVNADEIEILYRSPKFPTSSFAYAHDLKPELVHKIVGAFHTYRFPESMQKAFKGADRFYPITYKADWEVIRTIANATGASYDRKGLSAMAQKEAAKRAKKKQ